MHPNLHRPSPFPVVTSRRQLLGRGLWLGVGAAVSSGIALPRRAQAVTYLKDPWLNLSLNYSNDQVEWYFGCYVGFTSDERLRAENYGADFRLYAEFWEQDQGRDSWVDGDDGMWTLSSYYFGEGEDQWDLPSLDEQEERNENAQFWWRGDEHRYYFNRDSGSEDEIYVLFTLRDLERGVTLQTLQSRVYSIRA